MSDRQRMCDSKKRYETAQAARFFARTDGLRPYPCPHCKGWHLSSQRVGRSKR